MVGTGPLSERGNDARAPPREPARVTRAACGPAPVKVQVVAHGPHTAITAAVMARLPFRADGTQEPMGRWALGATTDAAALADALGDAAVDGAPVALDDEDDGSIERHLVIEIEGFIGWWETSSSTIKRAVNRYEPTTITLRIASPGGFVADALAIHDFLLDYARDHDCPVLVDVHGLTASAATVIACAGSSRANAGSRVRMSENALYLVHKPWGVAIGHDADFEQASKDMQRYNRIFNRLYSRKTGLDPAVCAEHIAANNGQGEWWDAETAQSLGYVDEVYVPGEAQSFVAGTSEDGSQAKAPDGARGRAPGRASAAGGGAASLFLPPLPAAASPSAGADAAAAPPVHPDPAALAALLESLDGTRQAFTDAPGVG